MLYVAAFHLRSRALGGLWPAGKRPKTLGTKGNVEFEVVELDLDAAVAAQVREGELRLARDGTTAKPPLSLEAAIEQEKATGNLLLDAGGNLYVKRGALNPIEGV